MKFKKYNTETELLIAVLESPNQKLWNKEGESIYFENYEFFSNSILNNLLKEWTSEKPLQDKDFVEAWNNNMKFTRGQGFYDAKNNTLFGANGERGSVRFDNYRKIPTPDWAIPLKEKLKD